MELLTEKIISSAGMPLSPGDCLRRVMEALSSGLLIQGPGLMDPCEKEPVDALNGLTKQQREDITVTAQQFVRYIAFRQIHKVLGMDPLPIQKYQGNRPWKFNTSRKRRRSGTETSEGKKLRYIERSLNWDNSSRPFFRWRSKDGQEGRREQRGRSWNRREDGNRSKVI